MTYDVRAVQARLAELGFEPGPVDGILGPRTESAIIAFKRSLGYRATAFVGPLTLAALKLGRMPALDDPIADSDLPWIVAARTVIGLREDGDDKAELMTWLRSDGATLGDPSKLPWCGDFVATAIRLALPEPLPKNPYWALNWRSFGRHTRATFGAVASISREGGGHVAFLVGEDAGRYYLLGGNQANRVSVVPTDKRRFSPDSFRWPMTAPERPIWLPQLTSAEASNLSEG